VRAAGGVQPPEHGIEVGIGQGHTASVYDCRHTPGQPTQYALCTPAAGEPNLER
jgi:hypothetical protein